jgi:hypothetical protein
MDSTTPSKDTIWQTGFKRKIWQFLVYKRLTLLTEIRIDPPYWLRMKGWKKIYQANSPWKQVGVAILISEKVDFKLTLVKRDKRGHIILIKETTRQEEIIIINLYAPNVSTHNFIKYTLKDLKPYIDPKTVSVGGFNNPLSPIDRSSRQKSQQRNPRTK